MFKNTHPPIAFFSAILFVLEIAPRHSVCEENSSEASFTEKRRQLVERVIKPGGIRSEAVVKSISETRRHLFVPENVRDQAYLDRSLPIGELQTISSPFIVALMTEILEPRATDRVLEIGTGSGYQAAVLSPLVESVYTIEIVAELQTRTTALLKKLGYGNISTKTGDGYLGWSEHAPFDKIIVTCSPDKIPQPLIDQLKDGGLMVIPVGERYQQMLRRFRKTDGKMVSEYQRPTLFVPMTGTAESQRKVLPDGSNPKLLNGDFEEEASEKFIPQWYYEFGAELTNDASAPKGKQVVQFHSEKAGSPSMLLQAVPLDGRAIGKVELSGHVLTTGVKFNTKFEEQPFIVLQFFDENRNWLSYEWLGPFIGSNPWKHVKREILVPAQAREGIVMIGLFGAVGTARFDGIDIQVVDRRPIP
jgi:protein-L-isoaspartate(D-aspartate) O-methyltransferase